MKDAKNYLDYLTSQLEHREIYLQSTVREFKEYIASTDDNMLPMNTNYIQNKMNEINQISQDIAKLKEEIGMITTIIRGMEN